MFVETLSWQPFTRSDEYENWCRYKTAVQLLRWCGWRRLFHETVQRDWRFRRRYPISAYNWRTCARWSLHMHSRMCHSHEYFPLEKILIPVGPPCRHSSHSRVLLLFSVSRIIAGVFRDFTAASFTFVVSFSQFIDIYFINRPFYFEFVVPIAKAASWSTVYFEMLHLSVQYTFRNICRHS